MANVQMKYVLTKRGKVDGAISYYWSPPTKYKACGLAAEALGKDVVQALRRATQLNQMLDDWRTGAEASAVMLPGSVGWLCAQYLCSEEFKSKAAQTQRTYSRSLGYIQTDLGRFTVAGMKRQHVRSWYNELKTKRGLAHANAIMRVAGVVFSFAVNDGLRADNPFFRQRLRGISARQAKWTPELVKAFCDKAREDGRLSIAAAVHLSYDLCQRQNDVIGRFEKDAKGNKVWQGMNWNQVRDEQIILRQNKTGQLIAIPLANLPETRRILEELPRTSTAIIADENTGAPYNPDWFRHEFRRIAKLAEIPAELQFRDLRRTGLSELGDAGATDDELRAVSGHLTRGIVSTYVVPSNAQASAAMKKRARMRKEPAEKSVRR